jgi:hypothetical protein
LGGSSEAPGSAAGIEAVDHASVLACAVQARRCRPWICGAAVKPVILDLPLPGGAR